jgi:Fe-S cluster assembly iron-binding protein IscA
MAQENIIWIDFKDKAIDKLYLAKGNRVTVKFKNISVPYLTGLVLRYSTKTQKKRFYSKYKYKNKTKWLKLNEFIFDDSY